MRATHVAFTGQSRHAGFARVHTVAPRSMTACVYASTRLAGVQASASSQSRFSTAGSPGNPPTPKQRASTRLALPSRIG